MKLLLKAGYTQDDIVRMLDAITKARDAMLGSKDSRTAEKVGFENHWRAVPIGKTAHCYGHNDMVQQSCTVWGPPGALKTYDGVPDNYQRMIRGYLNVSTDPLNISCLLSYSVTGRYRDQRRCVGVTGSTSCNNSLPELWRPGKHASPWTLEELLLGDNAD